jgi:membrane protease subunit HflK
LVYNQYRSAPDITRNRMYLDTMEKILENGQKLIVDGAKNQGVLPYLPLPELKQKPEKAEAAQ